ncbi:MAG: SGNH/GDSL hydrolase family protein [Gemmataceae bacterium]
MKAKRFSKRSGLFVLFGCLASLASAALRVEAEEKKNVSRWEKEIAAFEKRDKDKAPPKNPIVFVGSSSIRLWNLSKSFPRLPALNRGFGGSQLADAVHFAPRIVLKYEPRLIVLYAGDNDIAAGKTPQRIRADFQAFVKTVHAKLPKVRIVFICIKPSLLRWASIDKIRKANALVEAECKKDDRLAYLDIATPMLGDDGKPRRELFANDGLHLNAKGYAVWAERLKPYLEPAKK